MNDTSFIANPRARRVSNEITDVTRIKFTITVKK
jgi:hypothetical protein